MVDVWRSTLSTYLVLYALWRCGLSPMAWGGVRFHVWMKLEARVCLTRHTVHPVCRLAAMHNGVCHTECIAACGWLKMATLHVRVHLDVLSCAVRAVGTSPPWDCWCRCVGPRRCTRTVGAVVLHYCAAPGLLVALCYSNCPKAVCAVVSGSFLPFKGFSEWSGWWQHSRL